MNTTIGAVPANAKLTPFKAGSEFADTPYFGAGLEQDTEHMRAFPVGATLYGTLVELRQTKNEDPDERKWYACMVDASGNKFRIQTPAQLKSNLEQIGSGKGVAITYRGKEKVEGYKTALHQFEVSINDLN